MITGTPERFAIEAEFEEQVDGWTLGHFRFWLCGCSVGDWSESVDLEACLRWLRAFHDESKERYEPGLFALPALEVFHQVYDPVMKAGQPQGLIGDAYGRFHISHLGMSSFDRFDVLLITDEHGAERCLWRESGKEEIRECHLWRREMERVAKEFCDQFDAMLVTQAKESAKP